MTETSSKSIQSYINPKHTISVMSVQTVGVRLSCYNCIHLVAHSITIHCTLNFGSPGRDAGTIPIFSNYHINCEILSQFPRNPKNPKIPLQKSNLAIYQNLTKLEKNYKSLELYMGKCEEFEEEVRKVVGGYGIERCCDGVINQVFVSSGFVVKVYGWIEGILAHQLDLFTYMYKVGVKVPKLYHSGIINGKAFIVMYRLSGKNLGNIWFYLTYKYKETAIEEICAELKKLHSIKFKSFSPQRPLLFATVNYSLYWFISQTMPSELPEYISQKCERTSENFNFLVQFREQFPKKFDFQKYNLNGAVLVHNDLHFGNVMYDLESKHVTGIIDFDFARQMCPSFYLWRIVDFLHKPYKYVGTNDKQKWKGIYIGNYLRIFKKSYPELFNFPLDELVAKIRYFLIEQIVSTLVDERNYYEFNYKVYTYFRSDYIEKLLM